MTDQEFQQSRTCWETGCFLRFLGILRDIRVGLGVGEAYYMNYIVGLLAEHASRGCARCEMG